MMGEGEGDRADFIFGRWRLSGLGSPFSWIGSRDAGVG